MKTNNCAETACCPVSGTGFYGTVRDISGSAIRPGGMRLTERAISFCRFEANPRLLDVGCGTGATADHLRNKFHYDTIALDTSSSLVGSGDVKARIFPFIQGDARKLPFRDGSMDGIICECVISILEKPDLAFAEFARVIRPEGFLIVSDLYDRGNGTPYSKDCEDEADCPKNLRSLEATEKLVIDNGFEPALWEDHTWYMKELAAQLILGGLSADDLGKSIGLAGGDVLRKSCSAPLLPGYYLLVARKASQGGLNG